MWRGLKAIHDHGQVPFFTKVQWTEALEKLRRLQEDGGVWKRKLAEKEASEWLGVIRERLMHQGRHISQATRKNPTNPWLRKLWGEEKAAASQPIAAKTEAVAGATSAAAAPPPAAVTLKPAAATEAPPAAPSKERRKRAKMTPEAPAKPEEDARPQQDDDAPAKASEVAATPNVGWCNETKQAWRRQGSSTNKVLEYTGYTFIPLDSCDEDNIHAEFNDGETVKVDGMTVCALRAVRLAELSKGKALFQRFHEKTGKRFFITYVKRGDRVTIWMAVDDAGKKAQTTMLVTAWFGRDCDKLKDEDDQVADNYDRARRVALKILDHVTTGQVDGETCDYNAVRGSKLRELGFSYVATNMKPMKPATGDGQAKAQKTKCDRPAKAKKTECTEGDRPAKAKKKEDTEGDRPAKVKKKEDTEVDSDMSRRLQIRERLALLRQASQEQHGSLGDLLPPLCGMDSDPIFDDSDDTD